MSRTYSEAFLIELHKANPNRAGIALALACVKANLPAKYVANALEVTRMTVFSWFRGKPLRHNNLIKVETLTDLIESDTAKGLPSTPTHSPSGHSPALFNSGETC